MRKTVLALAMAVLCADVALAQYRPAWRLRTFLGRHQGAGAGLLEFKAVAAEASGRSLDRLWAEWIEQGEASTALLRQHSEPGRIADRYR